MGIDKRNDQIHIFFFPFMAQGHTIPLIGMAKLFAAKGLKVSIITTPVNAPSLSKSIERSKILGQKIDILIIKFPCVEAGFPEGCEHLDLVSPEMGLKFFMATTLLAQPLEQLLKEYKPDCLVADTFFPWSTEIAAKYGIPRIVFSGTSFFSTCASQSMRLYQPFKQASSDSDPFVITNFPGEIMLTRNKLPEFVHKETGFSEFYRKVKEAEINSYGILVNSIYEIEPIYADHLRKFFGTKAWHIGPISLWNSNIQQHMIEREQKQEASINETECLQWLDSKQPHSVIYISFGSVAKLGDSQLLEIAMGLEDSEQQFIWVVKKSKNNEDDNEVWLPEGFEKRMEGKGLIIRGWAPQVLILEHEAVGGFVTHCGWNSTLEAITAGLPMVTWPIGAEQFYNEKLVTEVLRIGVSVGAQKWQRTVGDTVKKEAIKNAITGVMVGNEAEEMRCRAMKLGEMARKAVEEGGSSYCDLNSFIEELKSKKI